jgi:GGDEF domain-containing protein
MQAKSVLGVLRIRNQLDKGLLASLEGDEFCVISDQNISKRKISVSDISQQLVVNPCEMSERLAKNPCEMCASRSVHNITCGD